MHRVSNDLDRFSMKRMIESNNTFKTLKYSRYATDVKFKHANKPNEIM